MINERKLREIIHRTGEQWRSKNKELFSCFDADKLWERVHAFTDLEPDADFNSVLKSLDFGEPNKRSVMRAVISEEGPDQQEMLAEALELALDRAFLTLFDRGALAKLFVVEEIPAKAQRDLDRIAARVEAAKPKATVAAVAPAPSADPVDVCVREFHEMGANAFRAKYLNNMNNRPFYEAAIAAGRI